MFTDVSWVVHLLAFGIILDAVTSIYAVKNKIGTEGNPILNVFSKLIGFVPTILLSHIVLLYGLYSYSFNITENQVYFLLIIFWGVVIWNTYGILKSKNIKN